MLKEKLLQDLKEAMKNKDVNRKNAVQMVRTGILQIEKDKGIEVTDEQILGIIAKEVKIRKDSLSEYEKADRQDLIEQVTEEIKALETYLPKQLSDEELTEEVKKIIAQVGATSMKDMGRVMAELNKRYTGSIDGKIASTLVKNKLMS